MSDRVARMALCALGVQSSELAAQVRVRGAVDVWESLAGDGSGESAYRQHWVERAQRLDLDELQRSHDQLDGARFVIPGDKEWPDVFDELRRLDDPYDRAPFGLWVQGAPLTPDPNRIEIAGSRAISQYGQELTTTTTARLVATGYSIITGPAFGCEILAMQAALAEEDSQLVCVLPSGLAYPHPTYNAPLIRDTLDAGGTIITEHAPDAIARRPHFLDARRLRAALSHGIVITEATHRSAVLDGARMTHRLGHPVTAFPGPATSAMSAGTHRLIQEGTAHLVTTPAEIQHHIPLHT